MQSFQLHLPTEIVFGAGCLDTLPKHVSGMGKKALLIVGQGAVRKYGYLERVQSLLTKINVETILFEGIEPNPRASTIDQAAELARQERPRYVIALGGGSVMDAAKCIAMLAVNEGGVWEYAYKGIHGAMRKFQNALPLVCIPTVAATSSETDRYAVVSNWETREKCTVFGDAMFPKVSIIDPALTCTVPPKTTVDGAIDIIVHVLEDYLSTNEDTPLQDQFSLAIVNTVMEYLPRVLADPNDVAGRSQLSWCSSIALSGFLSAGRDGGWPIHAIEHALSARYDISHGRGLSALLPAMLQFNLRHSAQKILNLGLLLPAATPVETPEQTISALVDWMKTMGAYTPLSELGIEPSDFAAIADDVIRLNGNVHGYLDNIVPMNKEDIVEVLRGGESTHIQAKTADA